MSTKQLAWHSDRLLAEVSGKDVRKEHPTHDQGIVDPPFGFKEWIETLDHGNVEPNNVVANKFIRAF
jgi:hypothetical protein